MQRMTQQNTLSLNVSVGFDREESASSNLETWTRKNLVDIMLERTEQWNLVSGLIRGILNRKRIESRQDNQDLDAALENE